jgi:hypothetical protein
VLRRVRVASPHPLPTDQQLNNQKKRPKNSEGL